MRPRHRRSPPACVSHATSGGATAARAGVGRAGQVAPCARRRSSAQRRRTTPSSASRRRRSKTRADAINAASCRALSSIVDARSSARPAALAMRQHRTYARAVAGSGTTLGLLRCEGQRSTRRAVIALGDVAAGVAVPEVVRGSDQPGILMSCSGGSSRPSARDPRARSCARSMRRRCSRRLGSPVAPVAGWCARSVSRPSSARRRPTARTTGAATPTSSRSA